MAKHLFFLCRINYKGAEELIFPMKERKTGIPVGMPVLFEGYLIRSCKIRCVE
jgi:hypothetical protein